jgi:prepilin-type N-terminal cleavage/methylation domain-containing protein
MKSNHAFTLIELLLVITIVSILGVTTTPFLSNFLVKTNFRTTLNQVESYLQKAQAYAIDNKLDQIWGVCLSGDILRLFAGTCSSPIYSEEYNLPRNVNIANFSEVTFSKFRGEPSAVQAIVFSTDIESHTISLNSIGVMSYDATGPTPSPSTSPTPSPSASASPSPSPSPTPTPTLTPTPTPSPTASPTPPPVPENFAIDSFWDTGYCAHFEITNPSSTETVYQWDLAFTMTDFTLSSTWGGTFTNSGNDYSVEPDSWNQSINPGATSTEINFCADITGSNYYPTNISYNLYYIDSCNAYCINNWAISGICRDKKQTCWANGESNESAGDVYCTGGKDVDTCCCDY